MIEVEHLTKDYGTVVAVRDVSFRVGAGEIVGVLGPNGAGKSTTLRMLAGFLGPSSGSVRVAGHDVQREPLQARAALGYMPEAAPLYPELRVGEYLSFRAALKCVPGRARAAAVQTAMSQAGVVDMRETLIGHLSKGYRQRVALADALVAAPPLLILDEPTAGLDPNQIREVRRLIRELGKQHTILLSTHILSEVEATCDRAVVIHRGKLVAEGTLAELIQLGQAGALQLSVRDPGARAADILRAVPGVVEVRASEPKDGVITLSLATTGGVEAVAEAAVFALAGAGVGVRAVLPGKASLEEVFAALTEPHAKGLQGASGSSA